MTRISSAQRGLNAFIDQIVNGRSEPAATAGGSTPGAFEAHLATLNPNSGGGSKPENATNALLKNPNDDIAANQKDPLDTVSTLFAALQTEDRNTEAANPSPATQLAAQGQASTESQQTDTSLSMLLSLANKAVPQASNTGPEVDAVPSELPLAQPRTSTQKSPTPAVADVKRAAASPKRPDLNSNPSSSDLAASAQVTIAAVAAALTPQTAVAAPAARNLGSSAGTGVNAPASRSERTNDLSSRALPSDDTQIQSVAVASTPETESFDLFGGSSGSKESPAQPIKMTLSSIQAETHFAPVQQLSPTQQIVDFVASAAGPSQAAATSDSTTAAAAGSQVPDMAASTATSLAASPVKTLTLALEPDSLGTVTVTMRLVNSNLELKVEAEKAETTSLIEKDKGNLSDKLQSLGYSVDSMVVKTAAPQGSHLDPSNDQPAAGQGQQAANDASSSGASQNGGRNAQDQSQTGSNAQIGSGLGQETASPPSTRSIGDGIYL